MLLRLSIPLRRGLVHATLSVRRLDLLRLLREVTSDRRLLELLLDKGWLLSRLLRLAILLT